MCRSFSVIRSQCLFINDNNDHFELSLLDDLKQVGVEGFAFLFVPQNFECTACIDYILSMQDNRFVWVMWQVVVLQRLKSLMETHVVRVTEPTPQQCQETMRQLLGLAENMVTRLIQVQPITILKITWT